MAQESFTPSQESNSLPTEKTTERKDKKKNAKRSKFMAPLPISLSETSVAEKPKQSSLDMALAEYALKSKKDTAETSEPVKATPSEKKIDPETTEETEPVDHSLLERLKNKFETEESNDIVAHELPNNKVSFGEGVIDLGHIDEQVVLLRAEQSVFHAQPEQQHQAQAQESEPVEESQANFTQPEAGPVPLTNPDQNVETTEQPDITMAPESPVAEAAAETLQAEQEVPTPPAVAAEAEQPQTPTPEQPQAPDYQTHYQQQEAHFNQALQPVVVQSAENVATKHDVDAAVYAATKAGQNRGVVAGALIVGGYEHFKYRRREKKMEKAAKNQAKLLEKERENHKWQLQEKARQQAHAEKAVLPALDQEATVVSVPVAPVEAQATLRNRSQYPNSQKFFERRFAEPVPATAVVTEQLATARAPRTERFEKAEPKLERKFKNKLEKLLPKKSAKTIESSDKQPAERLEVPEGHRLETSAWHTIEVDAKTGKPVENPTFAYGQEYYRERSHEAAPRDDKRDAAAGEVALVAAAMKSPDEPAQTNIPSAENVPVPQAYKQKTSEKMLNKATKILESTNDSTGPVWPWLVAFVIIIILIVAIS